MADGEFTVRLGDETVRRLEAAARSAGISVQDYLNQLIERDLDDGWAESLRRIEEYDRTGESLSVGEALAHFDRELEKRSAKRR